MNTKIKKLIPELTKTIKHDPTGPCEEELRLIDQIKKVIERCERSMFIETEDVVSFIKYINLLRAQTGKGLLYDGKHEKSDH